MSTTYDLFTLKGPEPIGSLLKTLDSKFCESTSFQICFGRIPRVRFSKKGEYGLCNTNLISCGLTFSTFTPIQLSVLGLLIEGSRVFWIVYSTSSVVIATPSWKVRLGFNVNVYVSPSSETVQLSARSGMSVPSGLNLSKPEYTRADMSLSASVYPSTGFIKRAYPTTPSVYVPPCIGNSTEYASLSAFKEYRPVITAKHINI